LNAGAGSGFRTNRIVGSCANAGPAKAQSSNTGATVENTQHRLPLAAALTFKKALLQFIPVHFQIIPE
jgi:hypothetical protein